VAGKVVASKLFATKIKIRDTVVGIGHQPYVIAEMACAHDGDLNKAKALVDAAAKAKVDAIQLQLFSVLHQVPPEHRIYELLNRIEFSAGQWAQIFSHAKRYRVAVFAFVYDIPSAQLALDLGIDGMKLSSADLSNPEMLDLAAHSDLPITLGTGASTIDEISDALNRIGRCGGKKIVLMHGVQNFPTAIEDANIRRIQLLQRVFQLPVGYQDHTDANLDISKVIDFVAIGMGACVVEKHITLNRLEKGTDYQAALEPDELQQFVRRIRDVSRALGSDKVEPLTESDQKYRRFQKKKITAAELIPRGTIISRDNVRFLRTGSRAGIAPEGLDHLLGKRLKHDIAKFEHIQLSDVMD
jgi:sialic acid synthase SpsE